MLILRGESTVPPSRPKGAGLGLRTRNARKKPGAACGIGESTEEFWIAVEIPHPVKEIVRDGFRYTLAGVAR